MSVYVVQPGDSPVRIAEKLTGNGALFAQLVAANPQVPRVRSGNAITFAGLSVGQRLNVPSSWAAYGGGATSTRCPQGMVWWNGNAFAGAGCIPRGTQGVGAVGGCVWERWTGQVSLGTQGAALFAALAAAPGSTIPAAAVPPAPAYGPLYWQQISAWGYTWGLRTLNGLTVLFVCIPLTLRTSRRQVGVGTVSTIALELQVLQNQAATAPSPDADGSYSGSVTAYQNAGAVAVQQLGPDIDATYAAYSGYNNSSTQSAWQANSTLQAINNVAGSAQLSDAQNAQQTLQQMAADYGTASNLGQSAAASGGGGGAAVPTLPTWTAATTAAAQAVASASSLCNLGGASGGNATVNAFQVAYNANPVTPPAASLPLLATDGKYGPLTAAAVGLVLGGGAPAACKAYTNVPGGGSACPAGQTLVNGQCVTTAPTACAAGQVPDSVTGLCVAACPAGQIPANGVCIAGPLVAPSATATAGNGPLIAGVLIAVLGVGAVGYAVTKKKHKGRRKGHARRR